MTFEEFDKWQDELWQECVKMRDTKGKEYSHTGDRFANFKRLAEELILPPEMVSWIYCKKHLDSIASFIKTGKEHSTEPIRGRIVDAIVYLTLIGGIIQEKQWKDAEAKPVGEYFCECPVKLQDIVKRVDAPGYGTVTKIYSASRVLVYWASGMFETEELVKDLMKC